MNMLEKETVFLRNEIKLAKTKISEKPKNQLKRSQSMTKPTQSTFSNPQQLQQQHLRQEKPHSIMIIPVAKKDQLSAQ